MSESQARVTSEYALMTSLECPRMTSSDFGEEMLVGVETVPREILRMNKGPLLTSLSPGCPPGMSGSLHTATVKKEGKIA